MFGRWNAALLMSLAAAPAQVRPATIFDRPETLCAALKAAGIETTKWAPMDTSPLGPAARVRIPWVCEYPGRSPEGIWTVDIWGGYFTGNFLYRVSGDCTHHADAITIAVTAPDPAGQPAAQRRLQAAARFLFQAMHQPAPSGLYPAIGNARHYVFRQRLWSLSFTPGEDKSDGARIFWLRLRQNR